MAQKKQSMGKHVKLTDSTVQKLMAAAQAPERIFIDPWDLLAMERAESTVRQADLDQKAAALQQSQLETQMLHARHAMDRAKELQASAMGRARELAANLATRYEFDWQTHAYNPETGEVTRSN